MTPNDGGGCSSPPPPLVPPLAVPPHRPTAVPALSDAPLSVQWSHQTSGCQENVNIETGPLSVAGGQHKTAQLVVVFLHYSQLLMLVWKGQTGQHGRQRQFSLHAAGQDPFGRPAVTLSVQLGLHGFQSEAQSLERH